jgi:ABC-type lipoprotein export system ATPase subunit
VRETRGVPSAAGLQNARVAGPYVECRDLFKIYKRADLEVVALRGLDLEVQAGELIAIIGASGSGKSTLLNILAGLDRPSAGQVRVGSRDLLDISDQELVLFRRLDVGFIWQATARNLVSYLNVQDNIELPMALAGVKAASRREWTAELLSALDLKSKENRRPHQLSGGEQQRVAIGVALSNRPPLILADEPTGELDTQTGSQVFQLLRDLNRAYNVTVIVVTHYPGIAEWVDRVVHIRDGRIGSESFSRPTFQRPGQTAEQEYLVVDRAGRLQLPPEYAKRFHPGGLARAEMEGDQVTIVPAGEPTGDTRPPPEAPAKPDGSDTSRWRRPQ